MITGSAAKFVVAIAGAITTVLTIYYGTAKWLPAALSGIAALLVYLVPNKAPANQASPTVPAAKDPGSV